MNHRESPRLRRLRSDFRAMEKLQAESTIIDVTVPGASFGGPPESYLVRFYGQGLWRPVGSADVLVRETHEVLIQLGASYPRSMPDLSWKSPIFHPNVSSGGVVCLGGYGTHWVPSLQLDELCTMLWDMVRYHNYDVNSAYNREAAAWARTQLRYLMPVDNRPLRDRLAGVAPPERERLPPVQMPPAPHMLRSINSPNSSHHAVARSRPDVLFIDSEPVQGEIIDAELVESDEPEILYIE